MLQSLLILQTFVQVRQASFGHWHANICDFSNFRNHIFAISKDITLKIGHFTNFKPLFYKIYISIYIYFLYSPFSLLSMNFCSI